MGLDLVASASSVAVLVAAAAAAVAAAASLAAVLTLRARLRELRRLVEQLRGEAVPLVREARVVVEEAATEMVRVGDVLGSTESVSATVDSASRLAYRAFANPVVKVLAFATGVSTAARRLVGGSAAGDGPRRSGRRGAAADTGPEAGRDDPPTPDPAPRRHRRPRAVRR